MKVAQQTLKLVKGKSDSKGWFWDRKKLSNKINKNGLTIQAISTTTELSLHQVLN